MRRLSEPTIIKKSLGVYLGYGYKPTPFVTDPPWLPTPPTHFVKQIFHHVSILLSSS